jgi:predicted nuclease with TOPRIM domain
MVEVIDIMTNPADQPEETAESAFREVYEEMNGLSARGKQLGMELTALQKKMQQVEKRYESHNTCMEQKLNTMKNNYTRVQADLSELEGRFMRLQKEHIELQGGGAANIPCKKGRSKKLEQGGGTTKRNKPNEEIPVLYATVVSCEAVHDSVSTQDHVRVILRRQVKAFKYIQKHACAVCLQANQESIWGGDDTIADDAEARAAQGTNDIVLGKYV